MATPAPSQTYTQNAVSGTQVAQPHPVPQHQSPAPNYGATPRPGPPPPPKKPLTPEPKKILDPTCTLCKLQIVSIAGGVIIIILGFCNLVELLDMPDKPDCEQGLLQEIHVKGGQLPAGRNNQTEIGDKCKIISPASFGIVIAYTSAAVPAGALLLIAALSESGILALASAIFLVLSVLLYLVEVVLLYMLTPARQLKMYDDIRKKHLKMTWGLARAQLILSLMIVAAVYLYFCACAMAIFFQSQKIRGKNGSKVDGAGWLGHFPRLPQNDPPQNTTQQHPPGHPPLGPQATTQPFTQTQQNQAFQNSQNPNPGTGANQPTAAQAPSNLQQPDAPVAGTTSKSPRKYQKSKRRRTPKTRTRKGKGRSKSKRRSKSKGRRKR